MTISKESLKHTISQFVLNRWRCNCTYVLRNSFSHHEKKTFFPSLLQSLMLTSMQEAVKLLKVIRRPRCLVQSCCANKNRSITVKQPSIRLTNIDTSIPGFRQCTNVAVKKIDPNAATIKHEK